MASNTVTLTIDVNSSTAQKGIEVFTGKTKKAFSGLQAGIITLNQGFQLMGSVIRSLGGVFDSTVGQAVKLEKQIAEITTLLGDNAGAASKLTKEVLDLQKQYGTSQTDITSAYYQAISSGAADAATANELLQSAQKLSIGGITSLEVAVDGLTTIMNSFGKESKDAKKISDALFIGMKAGKTTVGELSGSIGMAAGLANTMNVDYKELIATISALTTGGINTSVAVTQINAAMVGLARQTPALQKTLKDLGIENVQAAIKTDGLVTVLKKIRGTTDGSLKGLTGLFESIEGVRGVVALTSDTIGTKFNNIMKDMGNIAQDAGAVTAEAYGKMADTFDQKFKVLSGKISAYQTELGTRLKGFILPALEALIPLLDKLWASFNDGIELVTSLGRAFAKIDFSKLATTINLARNALILFGTALIAFNMGAIIASLSAYAASAASAATATLALVAPVIGIVAAFAGIVVAIDLVASNWEALIKLMSDGFRIIKTSVQTFFIDQFDRMYDSVVFVSKGLNKLGIVSDETLSDMKSKQEEYQKSLQDTYDEQENNKLILEETWKSTELSGGIVGEIIDEITGLMSIFTSEIDNSSTSIGNAASKMKELKNIASSGGTESFLSGLSGISVGDLFSSLTSQAIDGASKFTERFTGKLGKGTKSAISKVVDALMTIAGDFGRNFLATLTSGAQSQRAGMDQISDIERQMEEARKAGIKAESEEYRKLVNDKIKAEEKLQKSTEGEAGKLIAKTAGSIAGTVSKGLGQFVEGIVALAQDPDALVGFIDGLILAIPKVIDALILSLPIIFDKIIESLPSIIEAIIDALPEIFETIAEHIPSIALALVNGIGKLILKLPAIFFGIIRGVFNGIANDIIPKWSEGFDRIFKNLSRFITDVVELPQKFLDSMLVGADSFVASIADAPKKFAEGLKEAAMTFILQLVEEIKGLFPKNSSGKIGGNIGGELGTFSESIKKLNPFAEGGVVPQGFPSDNYPARLTSGEVVLNKDQQSFLGMNNGNTQDLLGKILSAVQSPISVSSSIEINDSAFADIILELNRDNRRLA